MVTVMSNKANETIPQCEESELQENIENLVFKYISENNFDAVKDLYTRYKLKANFYDVDGMTPLQHACYKGNKQITEFLIELVMCLYMHFTFISFLFIKVEKYSHTHFHRARTSTVLDTSVTTQLYTSRLYLVILTFVWH